MNKLLLTALAALALSARAGEVAVAVAANFAAPMGKIAAQFERDSGHHAVLAIGATGRFYAQIRNGAPFDVLLAADAKTPAQLEREGLGVAGTRFTYAVGRLVLWSRRADLVDAQGAVLRAGGFERLALADPRIAPYGAAAVEVLGRLGLLETLRSRFVQGEDLAQTYQFVASGNAALGFVALSQVQAEGRLAAGSLWVVPAELYGPIRQDALLLAHGRDNAAAAALLRYLRGDAVRAVLRAYGYDF